MHDITFERTLPCTAAPAEDTSSVLALSMWIRAFFAGGSLFVVGLVSLFGEAGRGNGMLALAAAGVALAAISLVRTHDILREVSKQG
jgi:hypothetical protein